MEYEVVIGLEVHVQLSTESKIFCSCSAKYGAGPNENTCPVCLGMPGVLPVLNREVVERAIKTGLAMECKIASYTKFDRKNYFYPDLPKGYQISQYDLPIASRGKIEISVNGGKKQIGLTRIHMEEDAGKLVHGENLGDPDSSYVDLNRTGVPLLEIVSEPDIRSSEEAKRYLEKLKAILEYLEVSDCNMEEGSFRCDANVSIRPVGQEELGTRTELKNMNSFRFIQKAINYEINRQTHVVEDGGKVVQETRLYDSDKDVTVSMRSKEEAHDYRYFPEPDLEPVVIDEKWIERARSQLPELPDARMERFVRQYGLPEYDAEVLTSGRPLADYFESAAKGAKSAKTVSNWVMGEVMRVLKENNISPADCRVKPGMLRSMIGLIDSGAISGKIAKAVFEEMAESGADPASIVEKKGLTQITDTSAIETEVEKTIGANPKQVEDYKNGKTKLIGFFVGQVMKATSGKASPEVVNKILKEKLEKA
ncbi:Aspartyl-tRNA(Asn) amidotransferase subunit B @ Glutamyl-tRNA(Gln) amidotransferase subunit B [hydrothermal vent metagenome]|uniref:Aspartyl-tRNA(Asn) amidotransferase subunit B @ Glutamyl-tRNA(Gln) amidotransferase subunit B n=1 Tax=hydrothermal vent metagenome TaxID=652676 RepID=A0A3B1BR45_9ZZZZ